MKGRLRSSLLALVLMGSPLTAFAEGEPEGMDWLGDSVPVDLDPIQGSLPTAIQEKGPRPKSDPSALKPAATTLSPEIDRLYAPAPLALPNQSQQVSIEDFRPLSLTEAIELMEVNNPLLEAEAIRVEEAKSRLRAQLSSWYPTLNLSTSRLNFPSRNFGSSYRNYGKSAANESTANKNARKEQDPSLQLDRFGEWWGQTQTYGASANVTLDWRLIDPKRVPDIAAVRDDYEKAKNTYLITLRDLRLTTAIAYFALQGFDTDVLTFTAAVQASLVQVRDSRAKLQAGVSTKLDVLDGMEKLKVCVGYKLSNKVLSHLPASTIKQERVEPVYETLEGWSDSTQGARSWADLPATAVKYVRRIEELIEAPVALLSTSPERDDTILVHDPFTD